MPSAAPLSTSPTPSRCPPAIPLWDLDNCLITPHTANTWQMAEPLFAARVATNVERYQRHEPLFGIVEPDLGY